MKTVQNHIIFNHLLCKMSEYAKLKLCENVASFICKKCARFHPQMFINFYKKLFNN